MLRARDMARMGSVIQQQANATLLSVRAPGTTDTYDGAGTPGNVLWEGELLGNLQRPRRRAQDDGVEQNTTVMVFAALSDGSHRVKAGPSWEGSTVTIRDSRELPSVESSWSVLAAEYRSTGFGMDALHLELDREQR